MSVSGIVVTSIRAGIVLPVTTNRDGAGFDVTANQDCCYINSEIGRDLLLQQR